MIKKTLYIGNPAYLSLKNRQMVIHLPKGKEGVSPPINEDSLITKPIEDIGVVVLDNQQITITHGLMGALLENNVALITCDRHGMPTGLMLPLSGNETQSERYAMQIKASIPLKNNFGNRRFKLRLEIKPKCWKNV